MRQQRGISIGINKFKYTYSGLHRKAKNIFFIVRSSEKEDLTLKIMTNVINKQADIKIICQHRAKEKTSFWERCHKEVQSRVFVISASRLSKFFDVNARSCSLPVLLIVLFTFKYSSAHALSKLLILSKAAVIIPVTVTAYQWHAYLLYQSTGRTETDHCFL